MKLTVKQSMMMFGLLITALTISICSIQAYILQANAIKSRIQANIEAISKPLIASASDSVARGNLLKLKGNSAQTLYKMSNALAVSISGTSDALEKTDFTDAVPPRPIHYNYLSNDHPHASALLQSLSDASSGFKEEDGVYVLRKPLEITNGGELLAIFPVTELAGLSIAVFYKILPVSMALLAACVFISYIFGSRISTPIVAISKTIADMDGSLDLSVRLSSSRIVEVNTISSSMNHFINHLRNLLEQMRQSNENIFKANHSVERIAKQNKNQLGAQKVKLEQIVSAISEMTDANTEFANDAAQNSKEALAGERISQEGQERVQETIAISKDMEHGLQKTNESISSLLQATDEIGEVVSVISGIAEQTNLLALNAAIEAARAGEQGRGFAVVADEVRMLAVKTQESTEQVGTIIGKLQDYVRESADTMNDEMVRVNNTVAHVYSMDEIFKSYLASMETINNLANKVVGSTQQQAHVSSSIHETIQAINALTNDTIAQAGDTLEAIDLVNTHLNNIEKQSNLFKL